MEPGIYIGILSIGIEARAAEFRIVQSPRLRAEDGKLHVIVSAGDVSDDEIGLAIAVKIGCDYSSSAEPSRIFVRLRSAE